MIRSVNPCILSITLIACLISLSACTTTPSTPAYLDTQIPMPQRAADLVSRMTLEEKVSQMLNQAPAIPRLGVAQYNWWSEGLHGVARAGLATVFPQAIGLAASWDETMMLGVATAIGDEARAKHHAFTARDKRFIYQGLTLWSPNINIFRDPRWGRGQETYGEDPYLSGRLAVQFIRGLQGDHPHYLKTVATVKHFAVHSGPEPERHSFNARTSSKDLYDFYLPQFKMAIQEGGAYSLMCAYNRYNDEPACASHTLLDNILRRDWQFDGFVVSDCGAIEDLHKHHKVTKTPEQSAAQAVIAGTDLNCGRVYEHLVSAVEQGLITEAQIDQAVERLMLARLKLGMFDPPETVPYSQIPYRVVDSEEHRNLALEAARKSIVLLKNENQTLPLNKNLKTLAVIGPNADQWLMLLGNYNGVPADPITPLRGIREKLSPHTEVSFAQGSELASGIPMLHPIPATAFNGQGKDGLQASFYNNSQLSGTPKFTGNYDNIDINWQDKAPYPQLNDDDFSVRWQGQLTPPVDGQYQLGVISTCNTKVYLNGRLVVSTPYHFRDEYGDPRTKKSQWLTLQAGQTYDIEVTAIETYADAQVQLVWAKPQNNLEQEALENARKADAVVMVMGLTARMEGEEMDINVEGFRGGDRTELALPEIQRQLIKKVTRLGKPTVLVLLNGSAMAINWEDENIPAIIEAWYPGQAAGTAIADVLFGDYNPAGRLPVTFYKDTQDLADFNDYAITNQTYRYFRGEVLYPFGHGLSYSQFQYTHLTMPDRLPLGENAEIEVTVTNTSNRDAEEVVQVYLAKTPPTDGHPVRSLVAFKRIQLAAQTSQTVKLTVAARAFQSINQAGIAKAEPGHFEVSVGGGQPHQHKKISSNILLHPITIIR